MVFVFGGLPGSALIDPDTIAQGERFVSVK
jgi:hypothetical protein